MGKHKQRSTSNSSSNRKKHKKKHHNQKKDVKQEQVKKEEYLQPKQEEIIIKEKPCFEASGILAQYAENALGNGKVLKFTIPFDAKIPTANWQLFPFKGTQSFPSIPLKGKSVFLIGKDKEIVDILVENLSVSKQHCVLQFREIKKVNSQGEVLSYIKPYAMDLESTNGTYLNEQQLEPARYYELLEEDVQYINYNFYYTQIRKERQRICTYQIMMFIIYQLIQNRIGSSQSDFQNLIHQLFLLISRT